MTSLCLRNQKFGHKLLSLQKPTFKASNFVGKCNISMQKPQIEITDASVTEWTKLQQVTGKEKQERREGSPKKPSCFSMKGEKLSEGQLQTCSHISSPVDVGNTRHIHNAIVHHHQDKKMNGIPWRQQSEYLDNFYMTWKGWQFRAR